VSEAPGLPRRVLAPAVKEKKPAGTGRSVLVMEADFTIATSRTDLQAASSARWRSSAATRAFRATSAASASLRRLRRSEVPAPGAGLLGKFWANRGRLWPLLAACGRSASEP
jgi:hypothetical protein